MTTTRRVHQLRITAPRDDFARRGALLLEDALHTASLPDDGRVLLVRTLRVGTLRVGRASASIARDVEHSVSQLASHAVHALDASAAAADVVYFRDIHECIAALAIRIALQRPTSAWFWRLAVPAWRPTMSRDEALRALLLASLDTPVGRVGPSELVRALSDNRAIEPLLGALRASDGAYLLAVSGWREAVPNDRAIVAPPVASDSVPRTAARVTLQRRVSQWGAQDPRSAWLACALLVAERTVRAMSDDLPRRARVLVRDVVQHEAAPETRHQPEPKQTNAETSGEASGVDEGIARSTVITHVRASDDALVDQQAPEVTPDLGGTDVRHAEPPNPDDEAEEIDVARVDEPATLAPTTTDEGWESGRATLRSRDAAPRAKPDLAPLAAPQRAADSKTVEAKQATLEASAIGGLFLLLPVMARLGLVAELESNPELIEADFPRRLLHYVARRLGADDRDSAFKAVVVDEDHAWRRDLVQWTVRIRRWCRTKTGLPMGAIAHRRARIAATRTHIDVHFPLSQVDLRIRRTGLDIDPGWLPWFGRVVRFHYHSERGVDGD